MKSQTYSRQDIEVLFWLAIAPVAFYFTAKKNDRFLRQQVYAVAIYLIGVTISWGLLLLMQGFNLTSLFISNLALFFVFLHTIGFYEKYSSSSRLTDGRHDIQTYTFHVAAVVGFMLVTVKYGRWALCSVGNFFDFRASACENYSGELLWAAIGIYGLTLFIVQAANLFEVTLIDQENPLSRDSPYRAGHDLGYGGYLFVVLMLGIFS